MNAIVNMLRIIYHRNKILFFILIIGILLFIVGCSGGGTGYAPAAPSGPVGGGCG